MTKRIRYLKTLQHLARKHKAYLTLRFNGGNQWIGYFETFREKLEVRDTNFTQMLQKLHYEIRKGE